MADPHAKHTGGQGEPRPDRPIQSAPPVDALSTDGAAGTPATRAPPRSGTTPGSAENGESRYPPAPDQPQPPLQVHIEVRVVDGPEGRMLRTRQAAAIREALRWFAAQQQPRTAGPAESIGPEIDGE